MRACLKTVNIDPKIGAQMAGFTERKHGCTGIHDSIEAKALAIESKQQKFVLITSDVIGIDLHVTHRARQLIIKSIADILPENIIVTATHTHSSVYATRLKGATQNSVDNQDFEGNQTYYEQFIEKIAGVAIWALSNLEEARIGFGTGSVFGLGTNRNNPEGYYDPTVNILKIENSANKVIGVLAHYACHPTILNHENYLITADFPGYFCRQIETFYPESKAIFLQGSAGNISTRYTKRSSSFNEAERLASILAGEVLKQLPLIETNQSVEIIGKIRPITFQVKNFLPEEVLIQKISDYQAKLKALESENPNGPTMRKTYVTLQGFERTLKMKRTTSFTEVRSEMQVLSLGFLQIITVPGDVFGEIGAKIRTIAPYDHTIVAGYANDFLSYFVSSEGYAEENYEQNMSIFDVRAEKEIIETAKQLFEDLEKVGVSE